MLVHFSLVLTQASKKKKKLYSAEFPEELDNPSARIPYTCVFALFVATIKADLKLVHLIYAPTSLLSPDLTTINSGKLK